METERDRGAADALDHDHVCRAARGDGFTRTGGEPSYAPDLALEPRHIDVRLRFDLDRRRAEGTVATIVRANRAGARTLRLDAVDLDDVAVSGGDGASLRWDQDGRSIRVTWDKPFAANEERTVEVRYSVTAPVTGMVFRRPDEAYPDRPLLVGTDNETERARHWLPCVDYPSVRTTFDFHLTAPREFTILANGTLAGETDNGDGTKTAHWSLEQPCPSYLCCLAVGRFTRCDDETVDGRPVAYFAAERFSAADLKRTFGPTPGMLRWIQERLRRPFPYPKYFQLALPGIGGAMENISLVTWDDVFVAEEALHAEWGPFIDSVNIHEMAHSYFGDAVVCRHFEHSWLKESWATYIETVWKQENATPEDAEFDLFKNARDYFREADEKYVRPLVTRTYDSSFDLFDMHLYPGGACRLHMLRHRLGEDVFWAATTDYLATYSGRVVETDDFRRTLETHAGLNLVRFFDQWIYGKGYPRIEAKWKHDAETNEATLTLEQKQEDETKGVGLFTFPLEVEIEDDDGPRTLVVDVEERRHTLVVPTNGTPKRVRIDPGSKVLFRLKFNPGDAMLRAQLEEAPDLKGRIEAAEELIATGTRRNLQAVGAAMETEASWHVRGAVAGALGDAGAAEAVAPLAAMLDAERDPRVLRTIARAAGAMRDPRLRAALHGLLAELAPRTIYGAVPENGRPAAVQASGQCATRLGRELRAEAVDRLVDLARDPQERVRRAAGAALAGLGDARAIPALESLKPTLSEHDATRIDRSIARLRKGGPGEEAGKLREQIEKLEDKVRKLDERLQDFEARDRAADSETDSETGSGDPAGA